jgi:EAL domain-containing protein (putative c-di-GMP-specific phosphodiesterase class I)
LRCKGRQGGHRARPDTLVVAEGVETASERDMLVGLSGDLLQGYLLARPDRGFAKVSFLVEASKSAIATRRTGMM